MRHVVEVVAAKPSLEANIFSLLSDEDISTVTKRLVEHPRYMSYLLRDASRTKSAFDLLDSDGQSQFLQYLQEYDIPSFEHIIVDILPSDQLYSF